MHQRLKLSLLATAVALMILSTPATADLTLHGRSGGSGIGALAEGESVVYIQRLKMRNDWQKGDKKLSTIFDIEAQKMIVLNHKKRVAEVYDLASLREDLAAIDEASITVSLVETGETRTLLGRTCKGYRMNVTVPADPSAGMPFEVVLEGPAWLDPSPPGQEDYREFYLAAFDRGLLLNQPQAAKAQPGQAKGMAALYRTLAEAGLPYQTEINVRLSGGTAGPLSKLVNRLGKVSLTSTVYDVSTETLPATLFAIPTDYKVKQR